jgi:hypothetical protein
MDDDLMSLRGSSRSSGDDDLFGSFTDPDDLGFDLETPAGGSADADEYDFGDPFNLPDFDQPTMMGPAATAQPAPPRAAPTPAKPQGATKGKKRARRRAQTGAFGMTPQQRMVLSIFLFLDVAVLGVLILFALGAIDPLLF